jgi:type IV pilus assembly protein PilY1
MCTAATIRAIYSASTSPGLQKVVLLGTGRLLGLSDVGTTGTQSIYLIKDTGVALGNVRGAASMVQQTLQVVAGSGGTAYSLVNQSGTDAPPPVNLATGSGWYVDLTLNTGERVNLDPKIVFSTAVVVSNLPLSGSACTVGGTSFNYQFDLCAPSR